MKKILNLFALLLIGFCLLSAPEAAQAQFNYNYSSNIWVNSGMNQIFQKRWTVARMRDAGKNELADAMEGRKTNNGQQVGNQKASSAENVLRRVPLSQTSFKASPVKIMPLVLVAATFDAPKEQRDILVEASKEILNNYEQMLIEQKETRLKNNVAGAAAFAIIMSRSILTEGGNLSEAQSEAVLQDINALLASSGKFRQMPDIEKQKLYETLIITTGFAAMFYEQGKDENNAEKVKQGKDLAKTILSQFFDRPIDEIRFTEQGVEFN